MQKKDFTLLVITLMLIYVFYPSIVTAKWEQQQLVPVNYKSCDPPDSKESGAPKLWDGKKDISNKWCCLHAGYVTQQIHWVSVDLGKPYFLAGSILTNEGGTGAEHTITEDYKIYTSDFSIDGPWKVLKEVINNQALENKIPFNNFKTQFLKLEITDPQFEIKTDKEMTKQYSIIKSPTIIIVDSNDVEKGRLAGMPSDDVFKKFLEKHAP